nr:MAG TPA: hypothetical protein [Caudoviricetes sp.]
MVKPYLHSGSSLRWVLHLQSIHQCVVRCPARPQGILGTAD